LLTGAAFAHSLAFGLNIPRIGVHHLEAHLLAPLLEYAPAQALQQLPFVVLLVSGGHSMLIEVRAFGQYQILGETLDDAAGEAFDKTAQLLALGYPGGPALATLADRHPLAPDAPAFRFSLPLLDNAVSDSNYLNFSFSGLKTQVLLAAKKTAAGLGVAVSELPLAYKASLAHAFQFAITQTLARKCERAMRQTGLPRLIVAGGVGANRRLRDELLQSAQRSGFECLFPRLEFCTDNGAMVAYAGALRLSALSAAERASELHSLAIHATPRWDLASLAPFTPQHGIA
jgi:N6-L-threonylcarbamoyladenine synthase